MLQTLFVDTVDRLFFGETSLQMLLSCTFHFQWAKLVPEYFKILHSSFTLFKGCRCNNMFWLSVKHQRQFLTGAWQNKCQFYSK